MSATRNKFSPGSCLVREWRGETYEASVQSDGDLLRRRKAWKSLSVTAGTTTGAAWSGSSPCRSHRPRPALVPQALPRSPRDIASITKAEGKDRGWLSSRMTLAFIPPDVEEAIRAGAQPEGMTVKELFGVVQASEWERYEHYGGDF